MDFKNTTNRGCPILRTTLFRANGGRPQIYTPPDVETAGLGKQNLLGVKLIWAFSIEAHTDHQAVFAIAMCVDVAFAVCWRFAVSIHPPNPDADLAGTPLMRQYAAAKREHPDALLFFRLGDFYELFYEDARIASRELQITLTSRDKERSVPMCGVPYHAAENYLARLLRKGYRVAICEQMEDPKLTKKIVRREVTRVLTPGTALDPALASERNNFLAALYVGSNSAGLALLDLSTGDFRTTEFTGAGGLALTIDELVKAQPSEVLLSSSLAPLDPLLEAEIERAGVKTRLEDWVFSPDYAIALLERQLNAHSLEGFGLTGTCVGRYCGGRDCALRAEHATD